MDEPILITGGCGFVGTNLTLHLLEADRTVRVADNFSTVDSDPLVEACQNRQLASPPIHQVDVRDQKTLREAMEGAGSVVHLAAFTNVRESTQHPERDLRTNVIGTFNVLECARQSPTVQLVVFASSNAAVGEVEGAVDESRVPRPLSPYGASKLYGEALGSAFFGSYGQSSVSLRFANAYGPHSTHKTSVVHKFVRRALTQQPLEIYGDGKQTRDFIHVRDVVTAIRAALENPPEGSEIYQVATGRETSINTLADMIQSLAEKHNGPVEILHTDPRPGEVKHNYSSIEKIRTELGWEPEFSLPSGIQEVWSFYEERL